MEKMTHISISMFTVHYIAILQYRFYIKLCVNNIEVTVKTCTCTDVFTVLPTRDESGGMYSGKFRKVFLRLNAKSRKFLPPKIWLTS